MKLPDRPQTAREWARLVHAYGRRLLSASVAPPWPYDREYVIDVEPAKQLLGVERSVKIEWVEITDPGLAGSFGAIQCARVWSGHTIFLVDSLEPEFASMIVWHELTHAAQSERMGLSEFIEQYDEELSQKHKDAHDWKGYAEVSFEREAYLNMNNHFKLPLTASPA